MEGSVRSWSLVCLLFKLEYANFLGSPLLYKYPLRRKSLKYAFEVDWTSVEIAYEEFTFRNAHAGEILRWNALLKRDIM